MTYKHFLQLVTAHKKYKDFVADTPIDIRGSKGRQMYLEDDKALLSKDIGPGPDEIDITSKEVETKWAVREVFEALPKGVNH